MSSVYINICYFVNHIHSFDILLRPCMYLGILSPTTRISASNSRYLQNLLAIMHHSFSDIMSPTRTAHWAKIVSKVSFLYYGIACDMRKYFLPMCIVTTLFCYTTHILLCFNKLPCEWIQIQSSHSGQSVKQEYVHTLGCTVPKMQSTHSN